MNIDMCYVPFSRFGSYLALKQDNGLWLTTMHGFWHEEMKLFKIIFEKEEQEFDYIVEASPWALTINTNSGFVVITLNNTNGILIKSYGVDIWLEANDGNAECSDVNMSSNFVFWNGKLKATIFSLDSEQVICPNSHAVHIKTNDLACGAYIAVQGNEEESLCFPESLDNLNASTIKHEYEEWVSKFPKFGNEYCETAELAQYILWASTVHPCGNLARDTVLMSKNWMHYVWSWDHCFNAIALANAHPLLAWDQLCVIFDKQLENGMLPDLIYPNGMNLGETKPPIHGWCLERLLDKGVLLSQVQLEWIYNRIAKQTQWWFKERDDDKDGICQYNLNNESGHDNSTVFDDGLPVESPDLTSFIIMQLHCLHRVANMLGKEVEARQWETDYQNLLMRFLNHSWREDEFVSVHPKSHKLIPTESIINLLPLVLGKLLPDEYYRKITDKLSAKGAYLNQFGVVTESMKSTCFNKLNSGWDNIHEPGTTYWRGPIWAPVTYLIVDGLRRHGDVELARKIAAGFCNMVNNQKGIFENYDPITGKGKCDSAYTWTCSVFLTLLEEYLL